MLHGNDSEHWLQDRPQPIGLCCKHVHQHVDPPVRVNLHGQAKEAAGVSNGSCMGYTTFNWLYSYAGIDMHRIDDSKDSGRSSPDGLCSPKGLHSLSSGASLSMQDLVRWLPRTQNNPLASSVSLRPNMNWAGIAMNCAETVLWTPQVQVNSGSLDYCDGGTETTRKEQCVFAPSAP